MEFTIGNPKTLKGESMGFMTAILHLAPARSAGIKAFNACPGASPGCIATCLNTAGRGGIFKKGQYTNPILEARKRRTIELFEDRDSYIDKLSNELEHLYNRADKLGLKLAVRPNGTSDLPFLATELASRFSYLKFYDYTKIYEPWKRTLSNYHLTFSRSETNEWHAIDCLRLGINVAVVFDTPKGGKLPHHWYGYRVIDGDESDLRFMDPKGDAAKGGYVIGLHAKGWAKNDESGFVVKVASLDKSLHEMPPSSIKIPAIDWRFAGELKATSAASSYISQRTTIDESF